MEKKGFSERKSFCLVEETTLYSYRLLSFILLLNTIEKDVNCVVVCTKKTKQLITEFPIKYKLRLHFITFSKKKASFEDIYRYILKALLFSIEKFGHGIFIRDTQIMVHQLEIPTEIKEQGYGFHKRFFNSHEEQNNKTRYNFELLYVRDASFITNLESLMNFPDFHKITRFTKKQSTLFYKNITHIEFKYQEHYKTQHFFPYETSVATEDFFSYDELIKLPEITSNLYWKEKPITFMNIRMEKISPQIKNVNTKLLQLLMKYNNIYGNTLHLCNPNNKISFNIPIRNNIGLWNRSHEIPGLYQVIEMFEEYYPHYCSSRALPCKYFSVNKTALIDKPRAENIIDDLYAFHNILFCSYGGKMMKMCKSDDKLNTMIQLGFYFYEKPRWLDNYFQNHKELLQTLERNKDSCNLTVYQGNSGGSNFFINNVFKTEDEIIDILTDTRFVFLENFDCNLMVLCFALGCIPVFECLDVKPFELECNKHYCFIDMPKKEEREKVYEKMRKNVLSFYEQHISPKNAFKSLVNHLFVRNIE